MDQVNTRALDFFFAKIRSEKLLKRLLDLVDIPFFAQKKFPITKCIVTDVFLLLDFTRVL